MKWNNYAFSLTEEQDNDEFSKFCASYGFTVYRNTPQTVYISGVVDEIDTKEFVSELEDYYDGLHAYIVITANDTDDSAAGTVYKIIDDSRTRFSSKGVGPNERFNWELGFNDLSLDSGFYA